MKFFLLLAAVLAAASAVSYEDVLFQEFNLYKAEYQKKYENPLENFRRMETFLKKKYEVAQHNLRYQNGEETYEMEINEFADWFPEEIAEMNGFNKELRKRAEAGEEVVFPEIMDEIFERANITVPERINWLQKGGVSPTRNQKDCNAGYAIAAVGALETQTLIKKQRLYCLSPQQVIDCSGKQGNKGCKGGSADKALNYLKIDGSHSEQYYPFEGKDGQCRVNLELGRIKVEKYYKVAANEQALKEAVGTKGTVAVAIHAPESFLSYKKGIYNEPKCKNDLKSLNHVVLLVGYDKDPTTNETYWIVRNSYGLKWGETGYIKMARNKNNMCGIATFAHYPEMPNTV